MSTDSAAFARPPGWAGRAALLLAGGMSGVGNGTDVGAFREAQNGFDRRAEYGPAEFDVKHRFVASAVWQLPVLYVCENTQWQAYVLRRETMLVDRVAEWAGRYGMPSESVDGNDWEAVTRAARRAVDFVRGERRPFVLETYTYRLRGHFEPDTQEYVEPTELAAWRARDPLALLERRLVHEGALDREKLAAIQARAAARIAAAAEFALAAPYPSVESLTDGVYA